MKPLYTLLTWDTEEQRYTPHAGLSVSSLNVPLHKLRKAMRELRNEHGYSCHRFRDQDGQHRDSDTDVLIVRTDGMPTNEVIRRWEEFGIEKSDWLSRGMSLDLQATA